ncbi:MAG: helix-turn-helix transcriptional regulator, partial [Verrucomicrobiaceae bacterium]|nr:helix-turn-helix transcriptional regulator [Verrucomicrobiaceae bacterium]
MDNDTIPPTTPPPDEMDPEFGIWLCQRICQKLKQARKVQDASAMEVATRPGACISDQTIYDNERGDKLNPGLAQLTRHSQAL